MKKLLLLVAILLSFSLVLASCNGFNIPGENGNNENINNGEDDSLNNENENPDGGNENPDGGNENPDGGNENPDGGNENPDGGNEGGSDNTEHSHVFGDWNVIIDATCTDDGLMERTCECGEKETEVVPSKGGHSYESIVISEHKYNEETLESTIGETKYICTNCSDEYTIIEDHEMYEEVIEPTCISGGYTVHSCDCGYSYTDNTVAPTHHNVTNFGFEEIENGSWIEIAHDPTACLCEQDRVFYPVCQNGCGTDLSTPEYVDYIYLIHAPGHNFGYDWRAAEKKPGESPCTQQDVWITTCMDCYDGSLLHFNCVDTEVRGEAPGHSFGDWIIDETPTESASGSCIRFCEVCMEPCYGSQIIAETIFLPPLNQTDYTYKVVYNPTCTDDGLGLYTYHSSDGYVVYIEVTIARDGNLPLEHEWSDWELVNNESDLPVCLTKIVYERSCSICGHREIQTSPAPGHNFGEWEETDGTALVRVCSVCGEIETKILKCVHSDAYQITTIPSSTSQGRVNYRCSTCQIYGSAILPVISDDYTLVRSGDCSTMCDVYSYELDADGVTLVVEVNVSVEYSHDEAPAKEACMAMTGENAIYYSYRCSVCKNMIVAYVECINHNVKEYNVEVYPTMTEEGLVSYSCEYCGLSDTEVLPVLSDCIYQVEYGNCIHPFDTYLITIHGFVTFDVEFDISGDYTHDDAPMKDECLIVEGDDVIYYTYRCSKCDRIIVAYTERK